MSDLPPGWEWATLDEIASSVRNGVFVSRPGTQPDGVPILRISSVRSMQLDLEDIRYSGKSTKVLREQDALLLPGDLLFTRYSGSREYVGMCARVPDNAGNLTYPDKLIRVRVPSLDSRYLAAAFASGLVRQSVERVLRTTAGQVGISGSSLKSIRIPIAPLPEQRRIVAAIEDHLSRIDAGSGYVLMAQERRTRSRDAVAMAALRGELAEASTGGIAVHEFMASLAAIRQNKVSDRRHMPISMAQSIYFDAPSRWATMSLDSLCWDIQYGTSAKATADESGNVIPVIRMGNIQDGILTGDSLKYLPIDHPDVARLRLSDGDVLFNRTNSLELIGKTAVYRNSFGPATFASYLIRCRLLPQVNPDWIALVINSPVGRRYVKSVASQQVGQANANGTKLAAMPIPLPSPAEQDQIMATVGELLGSLERAGSVASAVLTRAYRLRRSLLTEAFAGRLVPQDPNDEPASVLLERIRAERAKQPKPKRPRRTKNTNQETLL